MSEESISREVAIARIRTKMIELCDSAKSACQVAAEQNILCKGFKRDSDEELRGRYAPYVADAARISRPDLERAADHWHVSRQQTEETLVACDVQNRYYQICRGWNDFSNEQLSDYCLELEGVRPKVIGATTLPNI